MTFGCLFLTNFILTGESFADTRLSYNDLSLLISPRHEHLYEKIIPNVIRSDQFPKTKLEAERLMLNAKVVLCTISMLSNSKLSVFTGVAPIETVIVDEASQIEVGCYLPLVHHFQPTLAKLVLIGDDKQRNSSLRSLSPCYADW